MPWFYVDDGFSDSKPVLNMPDRHRLAACGLWVLSGSWSAKEESDGFVPDSKLRQLGARQSLIDVLTENGPLSAPLCTKVSGGIQFKGWEKWQKTREELIEKRRDAAERQRKSRANKRKGRNALIGDDAAPSQRDTSDSDTVTPDDSHESVTRDPHARARRPDPTRPDPITHLEHESSPDVGVERGLSETVNISASRLVAALIPDTIPAAIRTALRIQASQLMNRDNLDADTVADTLRLWLTKPTAGPGLLPALAADVIRGRDPRNGSPADKLRGYAELAQEIRAQEHADAITTTRRQELE